MKPSDNVEFGSNLQIGLLRNDSLLEHKIDNLNVIELGVRVRFEQISAIDTVTQTYQARMVQVTDWLASAEDRENYGKNKENYKPSRIINPSWTNAITEDIQYESFNLFKAEDGKYYNLRFVYSTSVFTEEFECSNFPFDVQKLSFVLAAESGIDDIILVATRHKPDMLYIDNTYLALCDWDIVHFDVAQFFTDWKRIKSKKKNIFADPNNVEDRSQIESSLIFRLQVKRRSFAFCIRVLLWLFCLGFISFSVFAFNINALSDRLSFSMGLIFAIIAFQFIISDQIPNLPYLTIVDRYNLFVFVFILLISFESVIVGWKDATLFESNKECMPAFMKKYVSFNESNVCAEIYDYCCLVILAVIYVVFHVIFATYIGIKRRVENRKIGVSIVKTLPATNLSSCLAKDLEIIPFHVRS
eukprot:171469_1